jgi:hypothetical protein
MNQYRAYTYSATSGISIAGPGLGVSYTPDLDPTPAFRVTTPTTSPQTVAAGHNVNVSVTIVTNSVAYNSCIYEVSTEE